MEPEAMRTVVVDVISKLTGHLRQRDVDGALTLFEHDAVLYGSEEGEDAAGLDDLRRFFVHVFSRPHTYGWVIEDMSVNAAAGVVWFIGPATVVVRDDSGHQRSASYRLSGVLRRSPSGQWRFSLFNGSEPVPAESS